MKSVLIAIVTAVLLIAICVAQSFGNAVILVPSSQEKDLRRIKLTQMAVLVNALSQAKSRLMIKSAATADPTSGRFLRQITSDASSSNPFLAVYPTTEPVTTRLTVGTGPALVRQYGRILGAMEVNTPVKAQDKEAKPDAYLLFVPITGPVSSEMPLWLVSLTVGDDGKVSYEVATSSTVKMAREDSDKPLPAISASIVGETASVSMAWRDVTYSLTFEMDIIYL